MPAPGQQSRPPPLGTGAGRHSAYWTRHGRLTCTIHPPQPVRSPLLQPLPPCFQLPHEWHRARPAAVGAAVWFDFFFTVPYYRFTIRNSADVTTFVLLLVVGVAVSQLAAYARRLKVVAIIDAGYLAQIHETTSLTQAARSPQDVVDHVRQQLVGPLDLRECRFEYGVLLGHPPRLEPDGTVLAARGRWGCGQGRPA